MKDYGYDVADYCAVDPLFGTLADFDALLAEAHRLGLKVMIDFVPSHTSDQHPWFQESRQSRDNPKADWYVWADPKPDGTPPSNWLSVFGGSAWEWEPRRSQYYLHNFLKEQPDLNFHEPAGDRGAAGPGPLLARARRRRLPARRDRFRRPRPQAPQQPAAPRRALSAAAPPARPSRCRSSSWNKARPELIELFLKPLHALTERYDGKVVLGEISGDDALLRAAEYTNGGGLDIAYSFDLLSCPGTPKGIRGIVERLEKDHRRRLGAAGRSATTTSAAPSPAGAATTRPRACAAWCRCCSAACAARSASTRARSWGSRRRCSPSSS